MLAAATAALCVMAPVTGMAADAAPTAGFEAHLADDSAAVAAAQSAVNASNILAVAQHEKQLLDVLAHSPTTPVQDTVRDGVLTHYVVVSEDCQAFQREAEAQVKGKAGHDAPSRYVCSVTPYAVAALYLGSYYNEIRRHSEALAVLDRGLAGSPDLPMLLCERNAAYIALGRMDDVMASVDRGLALPNLSARDHARLLRNRGYALTEKKRLDEAQQAYEASLQLAPGNPTALNELAYIAKLKGGAAATAGGMEPLVKPPQ